MSYISENLPLFIGKDGDDIVYTPKDFLELYDSVKDDKTYLDQFGMVEVHESKEMKKPDINIDNLYQILRNADYKDWDRGVDIIDTSKLDKLNEVFHSMVEDLDNMGEDFEYSEHDIEELRFQVEEQK